MYKKQFSVVLIMIVALVLCLSACAQGNEVADVEKNGIISSITNPTQLFGKVDSILNNTSSLKTESSFFKSTDNLWVIIETEGKSAAECYLASGEYASLDQFITSDEGQAHIASLIETQNNVKASLDKQNLAVEYNYSYTTINNGFAAYVQYGNIKLIEKLPFVERVIISEMYNAPDTATTNSTFTAIQEATGMLTNNSGYNGEGMTIGVIDSGLDWGHPAFQTMPENPAISKAEMNSIIPHLIAKTLSPIGALTSYRSAKIPFTFDYADKDPDTSTPKNSPAGYHGTHVSGIVAGDNNVITGAAPKAQLLGFKVFGNYNAGAYTQDIIAALTDAAIIGVDAVNLSLGSGCGFAKENDASLEYVNEAYETLRQLGIAVIAAAGNSFESSAISKDGNIAIENPEYGTMGSPSSYDASMAVASAYGMKFNYFVTGEDMLTFFNAAYANGVKQDFAGAFLKGNETATAEAVLVPGIGNASNFENVDVEGKIAVIMRGTISFSEKARNAQNNGAVGVIIRNNVNEHINAQIEDDITIPVCTIDFLDDVSLVTNILNGITTIVFNVANEYFMMDDYSSWGPLGDLTLKPDLTAPGGDIYSAIPRTMKDQVGDIYGYLSGTSMASPNLAGAYLSVKQYIKKAFPSLTEIESRTLAFRLMMSTANVLSDTEGNVVSPRNQGAGMVNVDNAVNAKAYLSVTGEEKTKLSLGADKNRSGVYTLSFNLVNMSEESSSFELDVLTLTEALKNEGKHLALASYVLEKNIDVSVTNGTYENGIVTVDGNSTAKIRIIITLDDSAREYLAQFSNGTFVEGYATFESLDENGVDLSIPYLAFYGDWTSANAFDVSLYEDENGYYIWPNASIYTMVDYVYDYENEEAFYYTHVLGSYDLYAVPSGFTKPATDGDKVALSTIDGAYTTIMTIETILLRDVYYLSYTIRDKITGTEYWKGQAFNVGKAHYNNGYIAATAFNFNLNIADLPVSNNQQLEIIINVELPYEGENKYQEMTVPLFIDSEAPVVYESTIRKENDRIYLEADVFDNHYLQCAKIDTRNAGGGIEESYLYAIPMTGTAKNSDNKLIFDITNYINHFINGEVVLSLCDYAGNESSFYVGNINGEVNEENSVNVNGNMEGFAYTTGTTADVTVVNEYTAADFAYARETSTLTGDSYVVTSEGEQGEEHKFTLKGKYLVGYSGPGGYVVIPKELGITRIYRQAFEGNLTITGIEIPQGVQRLEICTFFKCYNLEKIVLPKSLNYLGNSVFYDCVKLTELNLEDTMVMSYGATVFDNTSLKEITFPKAPRPVTLGLWMIKHCPALEKLTFNCDIQSTNQSIQYTPNLKEVIFNGNVQNISGHTLFGCPNLTKLEFNGDVGTIGAKNNWNNFSFSMLGIEELHFNGNVGNIYSSTFSNCPNLKKVVFHGTVGYIAGSAFSHTPITHFTIAEGNQNLILDETTGIMYNDDKTAMFVPNEWDYDGILELPETLEVIPECAFGEGYSWLAEVRLTIEWDDGWLKKAGLSWNYGTESKKIQGVIFPERVSEIKSYTFRNCTNLTDVTVSEGITNIGQYAFANCYLFEGFEELPYVCSVGSYAFENCYNLKEIIFSEDMSSISDYAFKNCYSLKKVEAPGLCDYLGTSAFENCYNLETITVSEDLEEVYYHAFRNCHSLKSFNAPCVYWLGAEAFRNCYALESVTLSEELYEIYDYTFQNCYSLTEITEFEYLEYIAQYAFANTSALEEFYFSSDLYYIANNAFEFSGLKEVVLNSDINFLPNVFYGLYNLEAFDFADGTSYFSFVDGVVYDLDMTEVIFCPSKVENYTLPASVEYIGAYAFCGNYNLTEIDLSNISYIGESAFDASALKNVELFAGTYVEPYAFANLTLDKLTLAADLDKLDYTFAFHNTIVNEYVIAEGNQFVAIANDSIMSATGQIIYKYLGNAEEIVIPEGVEVIAEEAFCGNEYVKKVILPKTIKAIGHRAFAECANLETVVFTSETAPALYSADEYETFTIGEDNAFTVEIYTPDNSSYKTWLWKSLFSKHYLMIDGSYVEWDKNADNSADCDAVINAGDAIVATATGISVLAAAAFVLRKHH